MRSLALRAGILGALAGAAVATALAASVAVAASTVGANVRLGLGPVVLVEVVRRQEATAVVFGSGVLVLAGALGAVNAAAALVLGRRRGGGHPIA